MTHRIKRHCRVFACLLFVFALLPLLSRADPTPTQAQSTANASVSNESTIYLPLIRRSVGPPAPIAEAEPNDTAAEAQSLPRIGLESPVNGTITADDEDWYSFTATANRTYVIETYNIDGTGDDASGLWLYNDSVTLIADDAYGEAGTGNANARIIFTPVTDQTYFVRVSKHANVGAWTGTYSIRVLPKYDEPGAAWDADNDNEPNDVWVIANELEIGLSGARTHRLFNNENIVSNDTDRDFYRFEAVAGRTYVIETYNIGGTGDDATGLWLYNDSGRLIADDAYGEAGTGNANARIIFTPVTDQTYFVRVSKHANVGAWTGTYSIRVLPKYDEPGAAWDANNEPNDVIPLANLLMLGRERAQTQQIAPYDSVVSNYPDQDFYRFEAVAGRTYVIETFNVQEDSRGLATGLWLYNDTGALIANDEYGSAGTGNVNARVTVTFENAGTYFVGVRKHGNIGSWSGPYSIRVCEGQCS